jgi:hypothetical protein
MGTVITLENLKEDLRRVYTQQQTKEYKRENHGESVLYAANEKYKKSLRKYSKVTAEIVARKATKQQIVGKWRKINI